MSALIGVAAPVAHRRIVDAHAAIDAGTCERKAERSRHRRFGITGIGRAVACRVTPHGAPCAIGGRIFAQARGRDEKERGEARRRQVDEVVEPGGGPAEGLVAGRAMADHTVGGVDRLVECGARESGNGQPEDRRDHRIGEILGEALDGRAGDAGRIERLGIAADDVRDCGAAGFDASLLQRNGDIRHVPVQASLRDQRAGEEANGEETEGKAQKLALDDQGNRTDANDQHQHRNNAGRAARTRSHRFAIEQPIERTDQTADPGDRMADRACDALRVTETEFDQHGDEGKRD